MDNKYYINVSLYNDKETRTTRSDMFVRYDSPIIAETKHMDVTIDRFSIHRAFLPIHRVTSHVCSIKTKRLDNGVSNTTPVSFPTADADGFLWCLDTFFANLTSALQTSIDAIGFTPGTAFFSVKTSTGIYSLTIPSNVPYEIYLSPKLYRILNGFDYKGVTPDSTEFKLDLKETVTLYTSSVPYNGSPVDKLVFLPTSIPVNPEIKTPDTSGRLNSDKILTDFSINGSNFQMLNDINFVTSGTYRWHNCLQGAVTNIGISVMFSTFDNYDRLYPLTISGGGSISIKLLFKNNGFALE